MSQVASIRSMYDQRRNGSVPLSPCGTSALASPHAREPGSHAARLEKGLGEYRNWWKEVSWKISPGSGSISRQGAQQ